MTKKITGPALRLVDEGRRICHVPRSGARDRYVPTAHATDHRVQDDDARWFGFACNHVNDLVPDDRQDRGRFLVAETGGICRDEAYVYGGGRRAGRSAAGDRGRVAEAAARRCAATAARSRSSAEPLSMVRPTNTSDAMPWGWWLRANGTSLEDAEGRRRSSVREAYWVGRLGFPSIHFAQEQQELFARPFRGKAVRDVSSARAPRRSMAAQVRVRRRVARQRCSC